MKDEWEFAKKMEGGAEWVKAQRPQGRGTFAELPGACVRLQCRLHVEDDGK